MTRRHWLLPDMPDVLGLLRGQLAITVRGRTRSQPGRRRRGMPRLAATVRALEHEADAAKGAVVREAFVTPLDPEDVFALSRGGRLDPQPRQGRGRRVGGMGLCADAATAAMAELLAESVGQLDEGVARLAVRGSAARRPRQRRRQGRAPPREGLPPATVALADVDDLRVVMGRQELYRRCSRMGEAAVDVAERLIYAGLKES